MQLTAQNLAEVVDCLLAGRRFGENEKRRANRTQVRVPVVTYPLGADVPANQVKVLMQDVSYLGVGLLQAYAMAPGARFLIRLPREKHGELIFMCVVRNCREIADSIFVLGAEFECSVAENMIDNVQKSWSEDLRKIQASILGDPTPVSAALSPSPIGATK